MVAVVGMEVVAAAVVAVVVFVYDPPEAPVALEVAFAVVVPAATGVVPTVVVVVVVAGHWTGCDSVCDAECGRGGSVDSEVDGVEGEGRWGERVQWGDMSCGHGCVDAK